MVTLEELQQHSLSTSCHVINKPAGWSIHNDEPSLIGFLKKDNPAVHFINRIDQETSGLVFWTERADEVDAWQKFLSDPESSKVYRALTPKPRRLPVRSWTFDQPISPHPEGRKNPFGVKGARVKALTLVEILAENEWFLDLRAEIKTGRQHQVRKHLAGSNLPIVGDGRYGRRGLNEKIKTTYGEDRLFLHSWRFEGVYEGKELKIEAVLPPAFTKLMAV